MTENPERWWRTAAVLMPALVVHYAALGHLDAFAPLLLDELHVRRDQIATWAGVLSTLMAGTSLVFAPVMGVIGERLASRWIGPLCFSFSGAGLFLTSQASSFGLLAVGRVLLGASLGMGILLFGLQARHTPAERAGRALTVLQSAFPLAFMIGPPLGALAVDRVGIRGLFAADAVLTLAVGALLAATLPVSWVRVAPPLAWISRTREVFVRSWRSHALRWNLVGAAILRGGSAVVEVYLPIRASGLAGGTANSIGWILGIHGAVATIALWSLAPLLDRARPGRVLALTLSVSALSTGAMALQSSTFGLALAGVPRAAVAGLANAMLLAHLSRSALPEHRMASFGLGSLSRQLGALAATALATAVVSAGAAGALGVGAAVMLLGNLSAFQLRDRASRPSIDCC